ncbi:energy transducer TonB [Parafilimonas sp.]|uniref:energy transducer TonB n=1 Tax=Parafilimonas sp. TaxID=1969739 RepID=UPI0039E32CEF
MGGNYIRKVIPTADSGFFTLDYNGSSLVASGFYRDTGFEIKIYTHYFYNSGKGFLQEIKCYDEMGSLTLHAEMNKHSDTIWRQTFNDDVVTSARLFPENEADRTIFFSMQKPAVFPGGIVAWRTYVSSNLRYPKEAIKKKAAGSVLVEFTVSKEGKVANAKAIQSSNALLNAEAVRLIKNSPGWIPAEENGSRVNTVQRRSVMFRL